MDLIIYDSENCVSVRNGGDATFRLTLRGDFPFSQIGLNLLGLKKGDMLEVGNEKGTKNWYIRKTDNERGFQIRVISSGLGIRNKELCKVMMKELKLDGGTSWLIAKNPVNIDGKDYYQLITSRPIVTTKGKSKK